MTEVRPSATHADGREPPGREWLEQVFRDHYAELCTFVCGYTKSDDSAEDIVQDLFLSIWKDPSRWIEPERIRLLLFVAARNRALDYLRHRRVRERHAERTAVEGGRATPAVADDLVEQKEIRDAVDSAIATLPDRAREIFLMNRREGLTYREIAEKLGISIKTVETQMSRSLKKLRIQLATFLPLLILLLLV